MNFYSHVYLVVFLSATSLFAMQESSPEKPSATMSIDPFSSDSMSIFRGSDSDLASSPMNFETDLETHNLIKPYAFSFDRLAFDTLDGFFEFGLPKDDVLDEYFLQLYNDLKQADMDENEIIEYIRGGSRKMGEYLRAKPQVLPLLELMSKTFTSYTGLPHLTGKEIEAIVDKLLKDITKLDGALKYLSPILSKYEQYIRLLLNDHQAKDKAIHFLFLDIINPVIPQFQVTAPCAPRVGRLLQKMILGKDDGDAHKKFLANKTKKARSAYRNLAVLKDRFAQLPSLDDMFKQKLKTAIGIKKQMQVKEAMVMLQTSYQLSDPLAERVLTLSIAILRQEASSSRDSK